LIGLSGFARQQAWLAIPLAVLSLVLSNRGLHRNIIHFISGVAFALGCMLTWLVVIGSWQDYVNQVFIWPLTAYSTLGATNNYNRYQFFSYIIESLVFIVAVLVVAKLQARIKWRVASIGLALLFTLIITIDGFWISQQANWKASIRVVLGEPQEKILISFSYFSALAVLIYCVYYFFSKKFREFIVSPVEISIAFFGLVGVVQLYPQPDVLHLWWVAPLFIPGGLIAFKKLSQKFSGFPERSFYTTLNIFSMVGIIFAILFMNRPWIEYEIPVLKGTYALSDKVNAVNKFNLVRNQIIPGETSFDCADGIYAVSDRSYSPPDEWFVNWGMLKMDKSALGKVRIICNQSLEYATRESLRLGWNLKYYEKSNYGDISFAVLVQP
jgi:hypothetical protein